MDRENIRTVLRDVFGANLPMRDIGGWVSIPCVLSPWTHQGGQDSNPSAGVSVNPNGTSMFNCFSCKHTQPLHKMLGEYARYTGEDLSALIEELEEEEYLGPRTLPDWDTLKGGITRVTQMPLDEGIFMGLYDSAVGHPYLKERGISDETAKKLELMFDPEDPVDMLQGRIIVPRILFPVRGLDGLLYGFSGRDVSGRSKLKVRDYSGLQKAHNVLGAHLAGDSAVDKVLVVEGLFDYAVAHEHGYCGCAVMHSTMTKEQAKIFKEIGKPVYLCYDNPTIDDAGAAGIEIAGKQLYMHVPTLRVRYPYVEIEDNSDEGYHVLKDIGETTKEELDYMVADCRLFEPMPEKRVEYAETK